MADSPEGGARYFLVSERLGFRIWRSEDVELAMGLWGDPEVTRFISTSAPSREDVTRRLEQEMASQAAHGVQYWPMFLRADGSHAGCCGLRPYRPEHGVLELGVHVRRAFWRQGLAMEAARAVIAHAFDDLGAVALFAGHNPRNAASRELLRRLGFAHTHDELYPPTGLMHPSYLLERAAWVAR